MELSCGLVREGRHLLVDCWTHNPGRKGQKESRRKGGGGGGEVLYSPDSPAI